MEKKKGQESSHRKTLQMFKCKYIEDKVRETLDIQGRELAQRDLRKITGIIINDTGEYIIPIAWYMDSSAYAMHRPNLTLDIRELLQEKGWEEDMLLFKHIKSFYTMALEEEEKVPVESYIGAFTKLTDLQLAAVDISDWSFLQKMRNLHMVTLVSCGDKGDEALRHLSSVYRKQQKRIEEYKAKHPDGDINTMLAQPKCLDYLAVVKMSVTDVSPFKDIKRLTELDLSWNKITDIEPMNGTTAYCLSLRHNNISDISKLNIGATYMLNLRWNDLQTVKPILSKIKRIKKNTGLFEKPLARLYLGNNAIPDDELSALNNYDFVDNDFREAAATNSIDLPDDIVIDRDDLWLIEKITDKDGNQKLSGHYADWTGSTATDLRIGLKAGMALIKDNQGNEMTDWAMSTSVVDDVVMEDDMLTITTAYSIYYLKKVQAEDK